MGERDMAHRKTNGMNNLFLSVVWFGLLCMTLRISGQSGAKDGEWPTYGADLASTRYRPFDQIDASNFSKLELAWSFKTDSLGTRPEYKLEGTPLMINGVLYTTAGTRRSVVALDAATGELLWVHGEHEGARGAAAPRQLSGRGLAYWSDSKEQRILYVTPGYRLVALDAKTGVPVPTFGKNGLVDLKQGVVYGTGQQIDLVNRSEEHTSELQSLRHLVCRLLLEKKKMLLSCCYELLAADLLFMRLFPERLDLHVHNRRQIELHQSVYRLRRRLEDVDQAVLPVCRLLFCCFFLSPSNSCRLSCYLCCSFPNALIFTSTPAGRSSFISASTVCGVGSRMSSKRLFFF